MQPEATLVAVGGPPNIPVAAAGRGTASGLPRWRHTRLTVVLSFSLQHRPRHSSWYKGRRSGSGSSSRSRTESALTRVGPSARLQCRPAVPTRAEAAAHWG